MDVWQCGLRYGINWTERSLKFAGVLDVDGRPSSLDDGPADEVRDVEGTS